MNPMVLKRRRLKIFCGFPLILVVFVTAFNACTINRRVIAGVSSDIQNYYDIYPSIELDVAAVTDDEANQIKSDGVDGYFSPANQLRRRLEPFTAYFDEETTAPRELHRWESYWDKWKGKKPAHLVIIADLPHSPGMPKDDPRMIFINIKKTLFTPSPVYIEIEPEKIVRVYKRPADPQSQTAKPSVKTSDTKM
jgi:hypothetical protein